MKTTQRMYHATYAATLDPAPGLCVTPERDAALGYLEGYAGRLYTLDITAAHIADEADIREAAEAAGVDWHGYIYDLADQPAVRAALVDAGHDACRYEDVGPDNAYTHETIVILAPCATVVAAEDVEGH